MSDTLTIIGKDYLVISSSPSTITDGITMSITVNVIKGDGSGINTNYDNAELNITADGFTFQYSNGVTPVLSSGTVTFDIDIITLENESSVSIYAETISTDNEITGRIGRHYTVSGESAISVLPVTFSVTVPANVTRGSNFDVVIQALNDDVPATSYVPSGNVTIGLASDDISDVLSPLYTDNTGWSSGAKTVSCQINGGTGSDAGKILVAEGGREGQTTMAIAAASTTRSHGTSMIYYGYDDSGLLTGTDDWTSAAYTEFQQTQTDALAAFDADTSLSSGAIAQLYTSEQYSYICTISRIKAGYSPITLSAGDKTGLVSVALKLRAASYMRYKNYNYIRLPDPENYRLRIKVTESASTYASGSALRNMTNWDYETNWKSIEDAIIATSPTNVYDYADIYIPIDKSIVEDAVGNNLYIWMSLERLGFTPYTYDYYRCIDPGTGIYYREAYQYESIGYADLILYK